MAVVVFGFSISFHALFRSSNSFGETLLSLFKAMLGEVGFFDEFSGGRDDVAATILLVVYLVIMTVILLNLLVAILSTSHAEVQENADREFRISKARMIQRYRLVVDKHIPPAPFNVPQELLVAILKLIDLPSSAIKLVANYFFEAVGRVVCWLVLGSTAVLVGTILWIASGVYHTFAWGRATKSMGIAELQTAEHHHSNRVERLNEEVLPRALKFFTQCAAIVWCLLGASLYLLILWLRLRLVFRVFLRAIQCLKSMHTASTSPEEPPPPASTESGSTGIKEPSYIEGMLKAPAGGVGADKLRTYLANPMIDAEVREDERSRGATVEHLKLLRNRIETTLSRAATTANTQFTQLSEECEKNKQHVADINRKLDEMLKMLLMMQRSPDESTT